MAGVPVHYLRHNASEWAPRHVLFVDTETRPEASGGDQLLRMRLWVGGHMDRGATTPGGAAIRTEHGATRAGLARWVDAQTVGHATTWLYCHNLGFDLTVSRLPDFLHRLGWTATQPHLSGRNVTLRMARRSKRLVLCDSVSLLPHPLAEIGRRLGRDKLPMPAWDAPEADWVAYCSRDVLVTAEAVLTLMGWWEGERLGHWTTGGPGLGWNALRHRFWGQRVLVNPEPAGVRADREAVYGGRRDVTRVGEMEGGPFALVDFENAHLTVAAHCLLPTGRIGFRRELAPDDPFIDGNRFGVLARCEVDTPVPRYPLRTPSGVFYPVGRFVTSLCSPEIVWARESGHLRTVRDAWIHDLGFPLQGWAQQCLDWLGDTSGAVPAVVRMMVKQWGRSVPGRFAMRTSRRVDLGPALWPGWHLERGTSGPDHAPSMDLHLAGRHWWMVGDQEADNAYPAVLAWVQSYVRVALGRMLEAMGEGLWALCDTDGAVLDLTRGRTWLHEATGRASRYRNPFRVAEAVCAVVGGVTGPLTPRVKGMSASLQVIGPQHYSGDTFTRMAGRPGKPEVEADGHLRWWRWPSIRWQMERGNADGFVRTEAQWTAPVQLAHRWVLDDGTAVPVHAHLNGDGGSHLSSWWRTPLGGDLLSLGPDQSPALRDHY
jgi:hypothetical protein